VNVTQAADTAFLPAPVPAQGGPPLITDDPDRPGPGHWEINIAALREKSHNERRVEVARVDLNTAAPSCPCRSRARYMA
jgi:hypothetical protein